MLSSLLILMLQAAPSPAGSPAAVPASVDPALIPNYRATAPGLATAGQPTEAGLQKLKDMGFRTVINLRMESEKGVKEEEAAVRAAGLRYVWVPFTASTLTAKDVEAVEAALADPEAGRVLLHCARASRVGAMWTAMQVRKGRPWSEAVAEGEAIGMQGQPLRDAVRRVVGLPPE